MSYIQKIQAIKDKERSANPKAKYLLSKVFAECCTGWANRTRVYSFVTKQEALDEAINLVGDYDISTTEWYADAFEKLSNSRDGASLRAHHGEGEVEIQASEQAEKDMYAELDRYHRITLGDFTIEIDELEA